MCFVSRVEQSKGLDTLKELAELLDKEGLSDQVKIDFYGQKTDEYFDCYLSSIKMFEYCGVLQPDEIVPRLKQYDALIFPSHYAGEGCPGILVEALFASIPIIASNWKYNGEFVINGDNGYLCETLSAQAYVEAIKTFLANTTLRQRMAARSYERSQEFSVERAKELMKAYI